MNDRELINQLVEALEATRKQVIDLAANAAHNPQAVAVTCGNIADTLGAAIRKAKP